MACLESQKRAQFKVSDSQSCCEISDNGPLSAQVENGRTAQTEIFRMNQWVLSENRAYHMLRLTSPLPDRNRGPALPRFLGWKLTKPGHEGQADAGPST